MREHPNARPWKDEVAFSPSPLGTHTGFTYAHLVSVSEDLDRLGRRVQRSELALKGLKAERRGLIVRALAQGLSERDTAALARCAPSYVHRLSP